jgi:hypothetical protein
MRCFGFSTGALACGDFKKALELLAPLHLPCVELSALRLQEVGPFLAALPGLDLDSYKYISFHAPSSFTLAEEAILAEQLFNSLPRSWPVVLHPDTIHDSRQWRRFGRRVILENMDRRKRTGRDVEELTRMFQELPEAGLCFDIGHARQYDSSMTEAYLILTRLRSRLVQMHISEVSSQSQHEPISYASRLGFKGLSHLIPAGLPILIESRVNASEVSHELESARLAVPTTFVEDFAMAEGKADTDVPEAVKRVAASGNRLSTTLAI